LQQRVLLQELEAAGLTGPDQKLPAPVRVKHGTLASGARAHFYLNYSAQPQAFAYPYAAGADVLTGRAVARNATVTTGPWDVAIIEER
jgi:beta-galactosidase